MADGQDKVPFAERVAQRIIQQLESGTAPWQKPWDPTMADGSRPFNPSTGKGYRGINQHWLSAQGFSDPRWLTYKQADALGAQVRRGEHGTTIEYWQFEKEEWNEETRRKETVKLAHPKVFWATVFNAEQVAGLPDYEKPAITWDANARAEALIAASGAWIEYRHGDRAFYSYGADKIVMPLREQFPNVETFTAVQLHELGHWTGHASRLNRDLTGTWMSESYAREELVAEISAYLNASALGLSSPGVDANHTAYIASWIKALKEDPREIFRAASAAEKVHSFVMAFDPMPMMQKEEEEARKLTPKEPQAAPQATRRREHAPEPQAAMGAGR